MVEFDVPKQVIDAWIVFGCLVTGLFGVMGCFFGGGIWLVDRKPKLGIPLAIGGLLAFFTCAGLIGLKEYRSATTSITHETQVEHPE